MSRRVSQFIEDLGPQDEGCEHVSNSGKPVNGPLPDDSRARRISSAAGWLNPATLSGGGGKENEGHYYPEASSQHWRPAQAPISSEPGSQGTLQPPPAQYLRNRGRPMSFYDIREAREQHGSSGKGSQRQSWASNNDYPHSYAGMSGADQYQYNPPSRAQQLQQTRLASDKETIPLRLPWTLWMNSTAKNHFVAAVGEFVGTLLFLFFAFAGTQVAIAKEPNTATTNQLMAIRPIIILYVSLSFGFSLMVNVWVFFRISGGLFNPAVTLAMLLVGAISRLRALCLFLAQVAGAIAASGLVMAVFPVRLSVNTTLSDGTSLVRGVFIEALLTAELVFTVLMLAKEKHKANFIAPVGIGLALFIVHLVGVFYTGGSANPARSLGPCIVTNTYDKELWIYWAGPFIGVLIAVAFYKFIKVLEYEMANPGQDGDDPNDPTKNSDHEVREKQRHYTARVLQSLGLDHLGMHHHEAHGQGVGRQPWAQTLMDGPRYTVDDVAAGDSRKTSRAARNFGEVSEAV
ncbi:Aquaporin-1 [Coniosporium tulheliwenetii]|uniref:Aquaporin-1 n=1 Tax=Coniosporium tulheliwenetii TaxID=3383036 RepID=A0ACC2ZE09_9PEZI|nr:Aquaporin-1 [Cladosporium sp. JES 115]